jgi:hypothetical protein
MNDMNDINFAEKARIIPQISERVIHMLLLSHIEGKGRRRKVINLGSGSRLVLTKEGKLSIFLERKNPQKINVANKKAKSPYKRSSFAAKLYY